MEQKCSKCGMFTGTPAQFCTNCGTLLAATIVQGRTVVMPVLKPAELQSRFDVRTLIDHVRGHMQDRPAALATLVPAKKQHEDTLLVEDHSGSMGEKFDNGITKLEAAIRASVNLVLHKAQLDPFDRIGVIGFSAKATIRVALSPLSTHKRQIIESLQSIVAGGDTDIDAGLLAASRSFEWANTDVVRRIVLLTDGHGGRPLGTAEDLKAKGVVLDVIGIGPSPAAVDEELLKKIASTQNGRPQYRFIRDHRTLVQQFTQLANKTTVAR